MEQLLQFNDENRLRERQALPPTLAPASVCVKSLEGADPPSARPRFLSRSLHARKGETDALRGANSRIEGDRGVRLGRADHRGLGPAAGEREANTSVGRPRVRQIKARANEAAGTT